MADVDGPEYMADREDEVQRDASAVQLAVAVLMLRRLASIGAGTSYAEAYAAAARDLGEMDALLERGLSGVADAGDGILDGARADCAGWAEGEFGAAPAAATKALAPAFRRARRGYDATLAGWCRTSMLGIVRPDGTVMPCREAYVRMVDEAVRAARAGAATRETLLRGMVDALSRHGLQVEYGSGRRMRMDSAVRLSFHDAMQASIKEGRDRVGEEFDADGYEISAHPECAPDHEPYQGRRFTFADFECLQARLKRPIGMYNCRHTTRPVRMGSPHQRTDEDLRKMRESSREMVAVPTARGELREVTRYEATQMQRSIERGVRAMREREQMLRAAGLDGDAREVRRAVAASRVRYKELSEAARLAEFPERMAVPTLRRE